MDGLTTGEKIESLIVRVTTLEIALTEIASGEGVCGAQAYEYKNIARVVLGQSKLK